MPVTKFDKRPNTSRFDPAGATFEEQYVAAGENDEIAVQTHALNSVPPFVETALGRLFIQNCKIDRQGHKLYYCTANYGLYSVSNLNQQTFGSTWVVSGTTTGGTLKVYACRELIAKYPSSLPDTKLIGIKPDGTLEGTEVVVPCLRIDISIQTPLSILTAAYTRLMGQLTGTVNTNDWVHLRSGHAAVPRRSDFKASSDYSVEVVHHVAFQRNLIDIMFAGFTVSKRGWDIWWPYYVNDAQANQYSLKSDGVYVQRVYDYSDFAGFLGFG